METFLLIAGLLVMAGVVIVLARGIGSAGKGDIESARHSNRMMRWRVGLQALAVVLLLIFAALSQKIF